MSYHTRGSCHRHQLRLHPTVSVLTWIGTRTKAQKATLAASNHGTYVFLDFHESASEQTAQGWQYLGAANGNLSAKTRAGCKSGQTDTTLPFRPPPVMPTHTHLAASCPAATISRST
jgi:hypothetical protein